MPSNGEEVDDKINYKHEDVIGAEAFKIIPQIKLINVDEAKHLWVGEPAVYRVLSEITRAISPEKLPLPIEI
jgi:hypothetical protein